MVKGQPKAWVVLHYGICVVAAAEEEEARNAVRMGKAKAIREALKRRMVLATAVVATGGPAAATAVTGSGGTGGSGSTGFIFRDADGKLLVLPRPADAAHAPASVVFRRLMD